MRGISEFFFLSILAAASAADWKNRKIPRWIPLLLFVPELFVLIETGNRAELITEAFLGAAACAMPLFLAALVRKHAVGGGDIKVMTAVGAWLGPEWGIRGLFLGLFAGACFGVTMILAGKQKRKEAIPLVPFLALGAAIVSQLRFWGFRIEEFWF